MIKTSYQNFAYFFIFFSIFLVFSYPNLTEIYIDSSLFFNGNGTIENPYNNLVFVLENINQLSDIFNEEYIIYVISNISEIINPTRIEKDTQIMYKSLITLISIYILAVNLIVHLFFLKMEHFISPKSLNYLDLT